MLEHDVASLLKELKDVDQRLHRVWKDANRA